MKRLFVLSLVLVFCFSGSFSFAQYYGGNNPYQQYKGFNPTASSSDSNTVQPSSANYPQGVYEPKIFGLGGTVPVIDVKAIAEAIKTYNKLKQQYEKQRQKYQLALKMASFIRNMPKRYKTMLAKFRKIKNPDDFFNQVDGFIRAFNGEMQDTNNLMNEIDKAYKKTTKKVDKDALSYLVEGDLVSDEEVKDNKNAISQLNLKDNSYKLALSKVAQATQSQKNLEDKIKNLEDDSLSSSEDLNTELAVLNKINASLVIMVKQQRAINGLLIGLLQKEITDGLASRDAEADALKIEAYKKSIAEEKVREYEKNFSLKVSQ